MSFYELLVTRALEKSECVALFVIVMFLLVIMHYSNLRRLDSMGRDIKEHTEKCLKG